MSAEINWDKKRKELAEASARVIDARRRELEVKASQEQKEAEVEGALEEKRRLIEARFEVFKQNAPQILDRTNKELFDSQGRVQGWHTRQRDWVDEGWSGGWKNGSPYRNHYTDHELVLAFSLPTVLEGTTKKLKVVILLQRDRRNIYDNTINPGDRLLPQTVDMRTDLSINAHTQGKPLESKLDLTKPESEEEMLAEFANLVVDTTSRMYVDEN